MTKLNKLSLALAMAVGVGVSVPAQAFSIIAGEYKMTVDGYINGTIYNGASCGGTTASAANIAACDAAAALPSLGSAAPEDSWGILSIASIVHTPTNTQYFTRGTSGFLTGYFAGLTDYAVAPLGGFGSNSEEHLTTGGTIQLFQTAGDYNPAIDSSNQANVLAQFAGPLWLSLDFVKGVAGGNYLDATYNSTYNYQTLAGNGTGYLTVTGGDAMSMFDTNFYTTAAGLPADAYMSVTIKPMTSGDAGQAGFWLNGITADVRGESVPEPASLALLGLGLVGLAAARRRKSA